MTARQIEQFVGCRSEMGGATRVTFLIETSEMGASKLLDLGYDLAGGARYWSAPDKISFRRVASLTTDGVATAATLFDTRRLSHPTSTTGKQQASRVDVRSPGVTAFLLRVLLLSSRSRSVYGIPIRERFWPWRQAGPISSFEGLPG